MNRIYQGRVSKVEILTGDKENPWQPLENWQDILWHHHQLFQDAVNYYIVALPLDPEEAIRALLKVDSESQPALTDKEAELIVKRALEDDELADDPGEG